MWAAVESRRAELDATLYELMFTVRCAEELILELYAQGRLVGTTHTSIGQEACAVGVIHALEPARDFVFSNHRCHGHYIAHNGDLRRLFAELMGRSTGVCGGLGGSQHLCATNFYTNGIQGGIVPVAVGMALAEKRLGSGAVGAVFLGDGTFGEGATYEALNFASLWEVPLLVVLEDNGYAQSTPTALEHAGRLVDRPRAFGVETVDLAATDVLVVHRVAQALVAAIRHDSRPRCLCLSTYRLAPHSRGEDYRPPEEIAWHQARDPLRRLRDGLPPDLVESLETDVRERVAAAAAEAAGDPAADFADCVRRVLA